jgi:hypothetical protein
MELIRNGTLGTISNYVDKLIKDRWSSGKKINDE